MCLAIPMQITAIEGEVARCEARGSVRQVSLLLLPTTTPPQVGDHLLVQLEHAIAQVSAEEAASRWELLDQLLAALPTA